MKPKEIIINDRMQKGYRYFLTKPAGRDFDPEFQPELTPKQMLEMGVFGGKYMTDCRSEFPSSWFAQAKLCSDRHDPKLNCFGVNASKPLSYWISKGWIYSEDPRGWFQWYCRYYLGRRCPDDERQIKRWKAMQDTSLNCARIVRPATFTAGANSVRRFCTGLMIAVKCESYQVAFKG
ncbi:MAG: hypothetical protein MZU79_03725 [Anaerotruncus sp.]|nr:hypothetical protein [Anaerotruncus sp.]